MDARASLEEPLRAKCQGRPALPDPPDPPGKRMFFRWGRLCGRAKFNLDPRTVPENRDEPLISYSFCAIERGTKGPFTVTNSFWQ